MNDDSAPWASSVYHAESTVACQLHKAWQLLLDYRAWNPGFAGAEVTVVAGRPGSEGEVVLIKVMDASGSPIEFCAETVRIAAPRDIVWYVYPKEGDAFANFLHFGLTAEMSGVRFDIYCYARDRLSGEPLALQRQASATSMHTLAHAFREYCESQTGGA